MTVATRQRIRLELTSAFDMLDFVQLVSDHLCRRIGFDDDAVHWIGVAVRESVSNAIKHGNHGDLSKHVFVEFAAWNGGGADMEMEIRIRDEGLGFDPSTVPDPLAPENLLKATGRGIFLIRHFMDEVRIQRAPEGGTEIWMTKRASGKARD